MGQDEDLKVLHLIPRFDRGGVSKVILQLVSAQLNYGNKVFIGTNAGDWIKEFEKLGVPWIKIPSYPSNLSNALISYFKLRKIVQREKIDLIHSHHRFTSVIGYSVSCSLNIPFVCTVHDMASGNRFITRHSFGENITVFSDEVASHLMNHFGVKRNKIRIVGMEIPSPILLTPEKVKGMKAAMGVAPAAFVIGFIGRLVYEKGPDLFLQAAAILLTKHPDLHFWIIGDGDMRDTLNLQASKLGILTSCKFFGGLDDVSNLISCFDITVVPSRREGFGLVAAESLAYGKPVVASRVGGLPGIVQHGRTGILVNPENASEIAEAIIKIICNHDLRNQMGTAAPETVKHMIGTEHMLHDMDSAYQAARS